MIAVLFFVSDFWVVGCIGSINDIKSINAENPFACVVDDVSLGPFR